VKLDNFVIMITALVVTC